LSRVFSTKSDGAVVAVVLVGASEVDDVLTAVVAGVCDVVAGVSLALGGVRPGAGSVTSGSDVTPPPESSSDTHADATTMQEMATAAVRLTAAKDTADCLGIDNRRRRDSSGLEVQLSAMSIKI